ncbi:MAG: hypothetical protein RR162_00330 [Oscillospiraceae bacterium]
MFWKESFLSKIRAEWLRRLVKFQYKAGGIWYDATITEKSIVGNSLKIMTVTTDTAALTITSIRVIDTGGEVAGEIAENITKTATQGVLTLWEFPLYEIAK